MLAANLLVSACRFPALIWATVPPLRDVLISAAHDPDAIGTSATSFPAGAVALMLVKPGA